MRLLLVDDDAAIRAYLDALLRKWGYEVVSAADGGAAWELLQREPIDFVISDWRMPGLDGVELCRRLRAAELAHYVYVILFTGSDQDDDLITALEAGADDFLTKPVNAKELRARIESGERVLSLQETLISSNRELQRANAELEASQARTRRDLQAAARIQQDLLPQAALTSLPIGMAWDLIPAEELAGDIFNFFQLDDRHLGFYLIDVSGHGVPAAMLSVHIAKTLSAEPRPDSLVRLGAHEQTLDPSRRNRRFLLRALPKQLGSGMPPPAYRPPEMVAAQLNNHFQTDDRSMMYFTMIYGVLDTATGQGSLCQAGHPYPLICRHDGGVETLGSGGFPIGMIPDAQYTPVQFQLHPGDRLLLYSDGITECLGPNTELFGERRLAECLCESRAAAPRDSIDFIKRRLGEWHRQNQSDSALSDDASILLIEQSKSP